MGVDARMFVKLKEKPTVEQMARWGWDLARSVGAKVFMLSAEHGWRALEWEDEADEPTSPHMAVRLVGRFYGPGYERGSLLDFCAVAEWLEQNIPGAPIFYGNDHGDEFELFDAPARAALKAHLYGPHGRDYYSYEDRGSFPTPPPCALCIPGEPRFDRNGFGAKYIRVFCQGCDGAWVSRDDGGTWAKAKDDE